MFSTTNNVVDVPAHHLAGYPKLEDEEKRQKQSRKNKEKKAAQNENHINGADDWSKIR